MHRTTATEARKKDTREKIELGGLIVKAGMRYENARSPSARDDFFRASAMQLLTALIADVCLSGHTAEKEQTLRRVRANLSEPEPKLRERLTRIYEQSDSEFVRENVAVFVNMTPETFSGVYANAVKETHWLSYPNYAGLVSGDAFSTDIFIALNLKVLEAHPGLARVIVGSLLNAIYNRHGEVRGRTLFLLDEVARLRYFRILETARDAGRKYGITLTLVFQSIGQMRETYGGRDASSKWFESASWLSFSAINDPETAEYLSKRCGETTVEVDQLSRTTRMAGSSRSRSKQLNRRPLILPHPLCLCCAGGVAMYIARFGDRHILKRMPGTGPLHDVDCDFYEPSSGLSGLVTVEGEAIVENVEDGTTALKLGFSLSKLAGRAAPTAGEAAGASEATADGARLSLKAMLHFLWDRAGFNRWRPAMAGRRNWAVVRKFLLDAAAGSIAKGKPLANSLYIPEMFDAKREESIVHRRAEFLSRAVQSSGNRRSLAILIGEVKEIAPSRIAARLVVKHAPRFPFLLAEDVERRMRKVFANELMLWDADADSHLIAVATFGIGVSGVAVIESIALIAVNENWIPVETGYEAMLVERLTKGGASFVKLLRFNLATGQPVASLVVTRAGDESTALYIVPDDADSAYRERLEELIGESGMPAWLWEIASGAMPELPS